MAITEEQVMKVLGRSPAVQKPNVREVVARFVREANGQKIADDTRIKQVVTKVIRDLVTDEECIMMFNMGGSSMRSGLNPSVAYPLSGRNFSNNSRVSHRGRLPD